MIAAGHATPVYPAEKSVERPRQAQIDPHLAYSAPTAERLVRDQAPARRKWIDPDARFDACAGWSSAGLPAAADLAAPVDRPDPALRVFLILIAGHPA